jgi:hypothetical protein
LDLPISDGRILELKEPNARNGPVRHSDRNTKAKTAALVQVEEWSKHQLRMVTIHVGEHGPQEPLSEHHVYSKHLAEGLGHYRLGGDVEVDDLILDLLRSTPNPHAEALMCDRMVV